MDNNNNPNPFQVTAFKHPKTGKLFATQEELDLQLKKDSKPTLTRARANALEAISVIKEKSDVSKALKAYFAAFDSYYKTDVEITEYDIEIFQHFKNRSIRLNGLKHTPEILPYTYRENAFYIQASISINTKDKGFDSYRSFYEKVDNFFYKRAIDNEVIFDIEDVSHPYLRKAPQDIEILKIGIIINSAQLPKVDSLYKEWLSLRKLETTHELKLREARKKQKDAMQAEFSAASKALALANKAVQAANAEIIRLEEIVNATKIPVEDLSKELQRFSHLTETYGFLP